LLPAFEMRGFFSTEDPEVCWRGSRPGCATASYVYNALGQRVEKLVGTAYTEYAFDLQGQVVAHHNRTSWQRHIIPLGSRPLARYQDSVTYFLHTNHLGSTSFVTDHAGATIQKSIYYPYGQLWQSTTTVKDERFASLNERDAETTLDPTLFRNHHSRLYRWLSPDPLAGSISNPQSLNRYAYVLNNPTNLIDPLGLEWGPPDYINYNPSDPCAYVQYSVSHAECAHPGYLWPNGTPIGGSGVSVGIGGMLGGGGIVGWNPNSSPVYFRPPSLGSLLGLPSAPNPLCDWSCTGPEWSGALGFKNRDVDYTQFTFSVNPIAGLFGFTVIVTIDKFGRVYVTPGVNITKGFFAGFSYTAGQMEGYNASYPPSADTLKQFLTKKGCSASVGAAFVGASREFNAAGQGTSNPIFMTPQAGISCGYGFGPF
jgi:RHS repeat-associated protein